VSVNDLLDASVLVRVFRTDLLQEVLVLLHCQALLGDALSLLLEDFEDALFALGLLVFLVVFLVETGDRQVVLLHLLLICVQVA